MVKKGKISQYRETLDRTLASDNLADENKLAILVKDQILPSLDGKTKEYIDIVVEKRVAEVSNLVEMLRSASEDYDDPDKVQHASWKLKQDTEEFRVMYREGPVGSPFHSLLVEGYIDAPLDVCLCVSWETALYPRWFPEMLIPTFKVATAKSLQKVMIGEEISLVRVKLSWPMSSREAILHCFEFEYLEQDLIVVVLNTISDVDNIQLETHGFTSEGIPDAENSVRIDLIGGFALQRVTETRSYFRTIGNMDIKLDFVPPSLINFISRQVIGSGFRFYQKFVLVGHFDAQLSLHRYLSPTPITRVHLSRGREHVAAWVCYQLLRKVGIEELSVWVASVSRGDEAFAKVLSGPLYQRIREALRAKSKTKGNLEAQNFQVSNGPKKSHLEDVMRRDNGKDKITDECGPLTCTIEEEERHKRDTLQHEKHPGVNSKVEDQNVLLNASLTGCPLPYKPASEIEEVISGTEVAVNNSKTDDAPLKEGCHSTDQSQSDNIHKNVPISPQVAKALGTLDQLINVVREGRVKPMVSDQPLAQFKGSEATVSTLGKHVQWTDQQIISAEQAVSAGAHGPGNGVGLRPGVANQDVMSPVQNPPIASWSRIAMSAGNSPVVDSSTNIDANGIDEVDKKTTRTRKWRVCCLHLIPGKLGS